MTYFKTDRYEIVRLLVTQIAMTMFGLVTALAVASNSTLQLLAGLLAVGLYFFLVYNSLWHIGAKDRVKIDAGRMETDLLKPVYMALFANIPNFIAALLRLFELGQGNFCDNVGGIGRVLSLCLQGYWLALGKIMNLLDNPFTFLVTPFLMIGVAFLGYYAGNRNFRVFPEKKNKKDGK